MCHVSGDVAQLSGCSGGTGVGVGGGDIQEYTALHYYGSGYPVESGADWEYGIQTYIHALHHRQGYDRELSPGVCHCGL